MASHDDPNGLSSDISFRMSKKIAQLTKVIYQLNCRCEDNESTLRLTTDAYENEIATMMGDAKAKLESLKGKLDAASDQSKVKEAIAAMTRQHQQEKAEALKQFEEYRSKVSQQEATSKRVVEERITGLTTELQRAKDEFAAKLAETTNRLSKDRSEALRDVDERQRQKDQEIKDLVIQYNERYKAMLAQQMEEKDLLEKEFARKEADFNALLQQLTTESRKMETDLSRQLAAANDKSKDLGNQVADLLKRLQASESARVAAEVEAQRAQNRCEQLQSQLDGLSGQMSDAGRANETQQKMLSDLRSQLAEANERSATLDSERRSLSTTNAKLSEVITGLEKDIAALKTDKARVEADLLKEREMSGATSGTLTEQLRRVEDELRRTTNALENEKIETAKLRSELKDALAAVAQKESECRDASIRHQQEMANLKDMHSKALRAAQEQAATTGDEAMRGLHGRHAEELSAMRSKHEAAVEEHRKSHAAAIATLQGQVDALRAAAKEAADHLQQTTSKHRAEVAVMQAQLDGLNAASSQTASGLNAQLEMLRTKEAELAAQLVDAKTAHSTDAAAWATERAAFQKRLDGLLGEVSVLKSERSTDSQRTQQEIDDLRKEMQSRLNAAEAARQKEIAALAAEHAAALARLEEGHRHALTRAASEAGSSASDTLQRELRALREQLTSEAQRALAERAAAFDGQRQALESRIAALSDERSALEKKLAAALSDRSASDADAKRLLEDAAMHAKRRENELNAEIQALNKEKIVLNEAMNAERTQLLASAAVAAEQAAIARESLKGDFAKRIAELEASHTAALDALIKSKDDERTRTLGEQQQRLSAELQRAMDVHAQEMETERDGKSKLERELRVAQKEKATVAADLNAVQTRLLEEQSAHSESKKAAAKAAAEAAAGLEEARRNADERLRRHIADLEEKHAAALAAQENVLTERQADWATKVKAFQRHIADLEYRIANRESRAEDVAKINDLLRQLREKDEALLRSYQESQKYKLDLINKESTYNKVFGRQPTVDGNTGAGSGAAAILGADPAAAAPVTASGSATMTRSTVATRPPGVEAPNPRARTRSLQDGTMAAPASASSRLPEVGGPSSAVHRPNVK